MVLDLDPVSITDPDLKSKIKRQDPQHFPLGGGPPPISTSQQQTTTNSNNNSQPQLGINLAPNYPAPASDNPTAPSVGLVTPADLLSPASNVSAYATPAAPTPIVEVPAPFPGQESRFINN